MSQQICLEDVYVMDNFCIERGSLLDNNQVHSLIGPDLHSVHCLVDIPACQNSGYEILEEPPADQSYHCRRFALDATGNAKVLALARSTGKKDANPKCTTCSGDGTLQKGFRATVVGTAETNVINTVANSLPPGTLNVDEIYNSSTTCASLQSQGLASNNIVTPSCTGMNGPLTPLQMRTVAHGSLMLLGWGILLPAGVVVAKTMRHRNPLWFKVHRALQSIGLILTLAGFILALTTFDVFRGGHAMSALHGGIGITVMIIGLLQPLNAVLRPHAPKDGEEKSRNRKLWEILHKGAGYGTVLLGMFNVILGTILTIWRDQFLITWGVFIAGILGFGAYIWNEGRWMRKRNHEAAEEMK